MLIHEVVDLAALLATHARSLLGDQRHLGDEQIARIWSASRSRFDAWDYDLNLYRQGQADETQHVSERLQRLALEIEAGELLTRTLAALFTAFDAQHKRYHAAAIGSNLLAAQRHASRQLSELIGAAPPLGESAIRVNNFRSARAELHALTDSLVAGWLPFAPVIPFGHNASRVMAHGSDAAERVAHGDEPLHAGELRLTLTALAPRLADAVVNRDLTQKLCESVIALFGPELFDSFGLLRSTWLRRMEQTSRDTQMLVDEWLGTPVTMPRW